MTHPDTIMAEEKFDCRAAFTEELIRQARDDGRIVAVCNDSVGSSNLGLFAKEFPDRLINVGIAEQNMVGVAAGLANGGYIPFVCAAGPFLTGRALEQIKADVAYSHFHVVLCAMSPGVAYGPLGPTHHSIEDLAWMTAISELNVVVPADPVQTGQAVRWAVASEEPCFLRISRFPVPVVTPPALPFEFGKATLLRGGDDVTLAATGITVHRALQAAAALADQGIQARVLNMATIKPIDSEAILAAARETKGIVTIEEALVHGGLGSMVAEVVVRHHPVPMRMLGFPGFAPTGTAGFLLDHAGLNIAGIVEAACQLLGSPP